MRRRKLRAISFFSGAMGLDLGIEQAGMRVVLACDSNKHCRSTITLNKPELPVLGDITKYTAEHIRKAAGIALDEEIDVVVGGPPCQAFSTAGARRGFTDARGNVFLKFVELLIELSPRYAIVENVRGILSAAYPCRGSETAVAGGALLHVIDTLRDAGYGVSFNLYNSANFGVPQVRERVVLLCSKDGSVLPHLTPTHSEHGDFNLPRWVTFREAVRGAHANGCDHVDFPQNRIRYYRILGPGQNWRNLPEELQKDALGKAYYSGGGKTGFFRRLSWNKPACTLVTTPNMPATDICHPVELRPLSIQEYKRLQMFPDDWKISGSLREQYRQIGNAVPCGLGAAAAKTILDYDSGRTAHPPDEFQFSRYKNTDQSSWETTVTKRLRQSRPQTKHFFED